MWYFYVYVHYKVSDDTPFYVGKGHMRHRGPYPNFERAYVERPHNKHWMRVVRKHGIRVEIVAYCATDLEAQRVEQLWIAELGRADLKKGPLINKTNGGEGHWGIIASPELRRKRSINSSGPRSEAFCIAIRKARKNGGNGGVVKLGDKLPAKWRASLSRSKLGEKNPWYGKANPALCKKVRNTLTGVVYPTIKAAAAAEGINLRRLYNYLFHNRDWYANCTHLEKV